MLNYRITKYNPKYRNSDGAYLKEEWTSVYDIEKSYSDSKVSLQNYLDVEGLYINTAYCLYEICGAPKLYVKSLGKVLRDDYSFLEKFKLSYRKHDISSLYENMVIPDKQFFINVCKMCLREMVWCKLESDNGFYIHFGYDYYMYVGGILNNISIDKCKREELYFEEFLSPYTQEE